MSNVTRHDIETYAIRPALAGDFTEGTIDAICDAVFEAAPLSTWTYSELSYTSPAMDEDTFWAIVERIVFAR